MKSGNLNFLETSGPPQTSNETALPLPLPLPLPLLVSGGRPNILPKYNYFFNKNEFIFFNIS
jgi:hypothetical protein